ncbi:hypothetical protein D3C78_1054890 [compost metagenome]
MDHLGGHPEHAEAEQDAHVRRQVGDGLEHRHEQQRAEAEGQHQVALEVGGRAALLLAQVGPLARARRLALEAEAEDQQRHQQAHQAGQEQAADHPGGADLVADPQHGGGHVADRRPGAAGVGGDHHDADVQPAFRAAADQLAQQRDHDDGGGQVVEHRGEEEGDETDDPQQVHALAGLDAVGDGAEALVGVDQLDDGHRAEQEEQDLGDLAQMVAQFADHAVAGRSGGQDAAFAEDQHGPAQHGGEDGRGGLVDFQRVFEGDAEVTDDKDQGHPGVHGRASGGSVDGLLFRFLNWRASMPDLGGR